MNEFLLRFTINYEDHHEISNDVQYHVHRDIAQMLADAGFGRIIPQGREFHNLFAVPDLDTYYVNENVLVIRYAWELPLAAGNIDFVVTRGCQQLQEIIPNQYHLNIVTDMTYL